MLAVALVILASVGAGVGAERRWGARAQLAARRALDALVFGLLPLVTFFTVSHVRITGGVGAGLAFGYAERGLTIAGAWLIGARLLGLTRAQTGGLMVAAGLANTGYLGIPVIAALRGSDEIGQALTYDIAVSAPVLLLGGFGIAAAFGDRAGETPRERARSFVVRNPPLAAFVLALLAPAALTPEWAREAAQIAVLAVAPLGFFALGVNLMQEQEQGVRVFPPPLSAPVVTALGLRLVLAPAVMLALSALLVPVPPAFKILAGMSCGINGLALAHLYGLDLRIVAGAIAWSTAIVLAAASAAALLGL